MMKDTEKRIQGMFHVLVRRMYELCDEFLWITLIQQMLAVEGEDDYKLIALDLYEDPLLQQVHKFIIKNKLSVNQGNSLLNLLVQVRKGQCKVHHAMY